MAFSQFPLSVTADHPVPIDLVDGTATVAVNQGDTLYYGTNRDITSSYNDGSLTAGQSRTFTVQPWVRSASNSWLTVSVGQAYPPRDVQLGTDGAIGGSGGTPLTAKAWQAFDPLNPKYGAAGDGVTDDTDAVQNALNDAATAAATFGKASVVLRPGYGYYMGQILVKSGVAMLCDGATIMPNFARWTNVNQGMLYWSGTGVLTDFDVFGGYWKGTGTETQFQTLFYTASGKGLQDCRFERMQINNWGTGPLYLRNPTRVRANFNTMLNPGTGPGSQGLNSINFVFDGAVAAGGKVMAIGNTVDQSWAAAINAVITNLAAGSIPIYVVFTDNITTGYPAASGASNNSGAIEMEIDVALAISKCLMANNFVVGTQSVGLRVGVTSNANAGQRVNLHHNDVDVPSGTGIGVVTNAGSPDGAITDNRVSAATPISAPAVFLRRGNRFSADASSGRATLVAGTVTVSTAEVRANENIQLTRVVAGGTLGFLSVGTIVSGTSFVINSSSATDTSTIFWEIVH